ncbi:response regulator [Aquipseudomonas campi]
MRRLGVLLFGMLGSLGAWVASPCLVERLYLISHVGWQEDPGATLTAEQGAADGRQAMGLSSEQAVDLRVADQVMPEVNGWELLAPARDCQPQMPVLLYSAGPQLCPFGVADGLHFDAAVLKPAGSVELIKQIEQLLERPA